ncbi:MAG: hypothetical protein Q8L14_17170 [Myxococcales bacterium]|nr:hypothetical protein [Myxococcales bacterium]
MRKSYAVASLVLFVVTVGLFAFFWNKTGFMPVMRGGLQLADGTTSFRTLWSTIFKVTSFVGALLGLRGVLLRAPTSRLAPAVGLLLNGALWLALVLLGVIPASPV